VINSRSVWPFVFRLDEVFVIFLPDFIRAACPAPGIRASVERYSQPHSSENIFILVVVFAAHLRLMQQPQHAGWKLNDNYKRRLK
jgi:hypothetical protein